MRFLLVWLLLVSAPAWAQPARGVNEAQQAFAKGQYAQAALIYNDLLSQGSDDYRLHYNLALAEQNLNHKGEARAHYERAHQLSPWDSDVNVNLARLRATLDDNESEPSAWRSAATSFSDSALFLVLTLANGMLFWAVHRYRSGGRELHLWTALLAALLTLACVAMWMVRLYKLSSAAVVPASVVLKNGPGREFTDSLSLHAGTLVDIVRREGDWTEIEAMGKVRAWIPESDLSRERSEPVAEAPISPFSGVTPAVTASASPGPSGSASPTLLVNPVPTKTP